MLTHFTVICVAQIFGDYGVNVRDRLPFVNPPKPEDDYDSTNCAENLQKSCTEDNPPVCACMQADCGVFRYCDWFETVCDVIEYNCNHKYEYFEVKDGMCRAREL